MNDIKNSEESLKNKKNKFFEVDDDIRKYYTILEKLGNIIEDEKPIAKKLRAHIKID